MVDVETSGGQLWRAKVYVDDVCVHNVGGFRFKSEARDEARRVAGEHIAADPEAKHHVTWEVE